MTEQYLPDLAPMVFKILKESFNLELQQKQVILQILYMQSCLDEKSSPYDISPILSG